MNVLAGILGNWLAPYFARFFSGSPWRFLAPFLVGTIVFFLGLLEGISETNSESKQDFFGIGLLATIFLAYLTATIWYAFRIRRGTWRQIWTYLIQVLER